MPIYPPQDSVILHQDRSPTISQSVSPQRGHHGVVNGVPPANRLPNELLVEIFCYSQNHGHFLSWIKVTAVCRYWRAVAISTPKLWTKIDMGKAAGFLHLFLERSRDALVDIYSFDALDWLKLLLHARNIAAALVPNAHRIRSLQAPMIGEQILKSLVSRSDVPMPRLESLLLQCRHFTSGPKRKFSLLPLHHQPCLRSLHLDGFVFPWTSTMFTGLVNLTLDSCHDEEDLLTIDTFLDFMETCPRLRYLRLWHTGLPEAPLTYSAPTRTVVLQNLRKFSITDSSTTAAYILNHLQLTPRTLLDLDLSFSTSRADVIPSLSRALPRDGLPNFASVQSLYLIASSDYLQVKAYNGNGATCLSLKIENLMGNTILLISSALTDIRTIFTSSPVNFLSISGAYGSLRVADWMNAMRAFPWLEYLNIGFIEGDMGPFFRALDPEISTEDETVPRSPASLLWPHLRELDITVAELDETSLDAVVRSLRRRATRGNRLEILGISATRQEQKSLLEQRAEIVRTLVDEFHFDEAGVDGFS